MPRKTTFLVVILLGLICTAAQAQEKEWYFTADSTIVSQYVWHGIVFNNEPVWQPYLEFGINGLSVNLWFNYELTDNLIYPDGPGEHEFTEADWTITYAGAVEGITYSIGFLNYNYVNTGINSTSEIFFSLGLDNEFAPTVTVYRDIDQAEGLYAKMREIQQVTPSRLQASSMMVTLPMMVTLSLFSSFGYGDNDHNKHYWGLDEDIALDLLISGSLSIALNENWSITPVAYFTSVFTEEIRDVVEDPDNFIASVSLTFTY